MSETPDAPDDSTARLRNLAESHAREADRLAHDSRDAPLVHAHLAIAYAILAGQEPRP